MQTTKLQRARLKLEAYHPEAVLELHGRKWRVVSNGIILGPERDNVDDAVIDTALQLADTVAPLPSMDDLRRCALYVVAAWTHPDLAFLFDMNEGLRRLAISLEMFDRRTSTALAQKG